jgi:hypothetical protein
VFAVKLTNAAGRQPIRGIVWQLWSGVASEFLTTKQQVCTLPTSAWRERTVRNVSAFSSPRHWHKGANTYARTQPHIIFVCHKFFHRPWNLQTTRPSQGTTATRSIIAYESMPPLWSGHATAVHVSRVLTNCQPLSRGAVTVTLQTGLYWRWQCYWNISHEHHEIYCVYTLYTGHRMNLWINKRDMN